MPPWTEEDEAEAARSGDLRPMATIPVWLKTSFEDCIEDCDSGEDDIELGLEVYDGYIDKTEASKPNYKGVVKTIKVISTHQASKRRRSPQGGSDMTGVYRKATSHISTKKTLTFNARMSVKPEEEWTEELFEEMFAEKPLPPTLEKHVGKLDKYEKEELIHMDIVCHGLGKLENNKDIKNMCNLFAQKLIEMREEQRMSNARIACLEKSDKNLCADLHRAASLNSPSPTHSIK
jgi:hypothetical protein